MLVYHEASPDKVDSILQNGLKRQSRGAKGDDIWIKKTDEYLDKRRPKQIRVANVSRDENIYAYVTTADYIVSITDGTPMPLKVFLQQASSGLVSLAIDESRCYVSDLDTYDALKNALESHDPPEKVEVLARSYWRKLTPLSTYTQGSISRPELLITYDIEPQHIQRAKA